MHLSTRSAEPSRAGGGSRRNTMTNKSAATPPLTGLTTRNLGRHLPPHRHRSLPPSGISVEGGGRRASLMESVLTELQRGELYQGFSSDALIFCVSSLLIALAFTYIRSKTDGNTKSAAWIVMLIASPVLSFFGTFYVVWTELHQLWTYEFIYGEDFLSRAVVIFFMASNVVDLIIGWFHYRDFLDPFTTGINRPSMESVNECSLPSCGLHSFHACVTHSTHIKASNTQSS